MFVRVFFVAVPTTWNSLSKRLPDLVHTTSFGRLLKTSLLFLEYLSTQHIRGCFGDGLNSIISLNWLIKCEIHSGRGAPCWHYRSQIGIRCEDSSHFSFGVYGPDPFQGVFWDLIAGGCRAQGGGQAWVLAVFILHKSTVKATFNTPYELLG